MNGKTQDYIKSTDFGVEKYGYNADVDGAETIWTYGGAFPWASVGTNATTTIVSGSTDDDAGGTGATSILVEGLVSKTIRGVTGYQIVRETVAMDGTSAVTLTNEFSFVYRAIVVAAGSGNANAGLISIKHSTTSIAEIVAGQNNTEMAVMIIPRFTSEGAIIHGGWVCGGYAYMAKNTAATANMVAVTARPDTSVFAVKFRGEVSQSAPIQFEYKIPQYALPGTKIELKATSVSATDQSISAGFSIRYDL